MKRAADLLNSFRQHWKKGMQAYSAFMEKQGFYLVLTICVLVIVGTAVWTRAARTPEPPPAADLGQAADMPYEGVQRLQDRVVGHEVRRLDLHGLLRRHDCEEERVADLFERRLRA